MKTFKKNKINQYIIQLCRMTDKKGTTTTCFQDPTER